MGKKKRRKLAGRPRQTGRDRYSSGRAKANNEPDTGTAELRRRRQRFTQSSEYPATILGILAGRGLISESHYAAAIDFRDLWISNYGNPWPRTATLEGGGGGTGKISSPQPSKGQEDRLKRIHERLKGLGLWYCIVSLAVFESDIWAPHPRPGAPPMVHVLSQDIGRGQPPSGALKIHVDLVAKALQCVADLPRTSG